MSDLRNYVQGQDYFLSGSGITLSATSAVLTSMEYPDGSLVEMADFGTLGYITFEPETEKEENASFTGITQNANGTATLTGLTRGLGFKTPYTADLSLRQSHSGGSLARISNSAPFYNEFANKANDETVTGTWTFTEATRPLLTADLDTAVNEELVTFGQLSRTSFAGVNNGSTVQKGIFQESTQAQTDARTQVGSTGADLVVNPVTLRATKYHDFAASSGGTDTYAITPTPAVTAYADGQVFVFEVDVANTGAATLNVSALGAKSIKKYGNVDLADNDLKAGSIVTVVYDLDSDSFMLQTPIARPQVSQDGTEIFALDAGATDAYAITLTPAPSAYVNGMTFRFGANTANTGAATLNVNALGAKTIKKHKNLDLVTGDISAGQLLTVIYDEATDTLQLQTPTVPVTDFAILTGTRAMNTASGSQTFAHGLVNTPKYIEVHVTAIGFENTVNHILSHGFSNGTNHRCAYAGAAANGGSPAIGVAGLDTSNCVSMNFDDTASTNATQVATASFDATNVTLSWTLTGTGNANNMNIIILAHS